MSKANDTKSAQLGIDFGEACRLLRKILFFRAIQRLGEDICFKCGKPIESVDEFSIEHKKRWQHVDPNLFWDLENIAYSHLRCNKRDTVPNGPPITKNGVPGMNWCGLCRAHLPISEFTKDSTTHTGLRKRCKRHDHLDRQKKFAPVVSSSTSPSKGEGVSSIETGCANLEVQQ